MALGGVKKSNGDERTRFLNALSSPGVRESAFPITGMTLTRGESLLISSMSISRSLEGWWVRECASNETKRVTDECPVGGMK